MGRGARLAWFAVALVIGHHVGTIFKFLGTVGPTEWADWIDLGVPFVVLGLAAAVIAASNAARRTWLVFGVGVVLYVQGQGMHLAANSVSNAEPVGRAEDAAHLWDEVVSHYVWYVGLTLVVAALVLALREGELRVHPAAYALAALVGLTWFNNTIEGGTPLLGIAVAAGFTYLGWNDRARAGRLLLASYGVSLVLFAVFGIWQGGFPQFSELGWI